MPGSCHTAPGTSLGLSARLSEDNFIRGKPKPMTWQFGRGVSPGSWEPLIFQGRWSRRPWSGAQGYIHTDAHGRERFCQLPEAQETFSSHYTCPGLRSHTCTHLLLQPTLNQRTKIQGNFYFQFSSRNFAVVFMLLVLLLFFFFFPNFISF